MNQAVVTVAVGAAVAIGTFIYYMLFENKQKEKPMTTRPSRNSPSAYRNHSEPIYSYYPEKDATDDAGPPNSGSKPARKPIDRNANKSSSNSTQICPKTNIQTSPEHQDTQTETKRETIDINSVQSSSDSSQKSTEEPTTDNQNSPDHSKSCAATKTESNSSQKSVGNSPKTHQDDSDSRTTTKCEKIDKNSNQSSNSFKKSIEESEKNLQNRSECPDSNTTIKRETVDENSIQSSANSSDKPAVETCTVCDKTANAKFLPCEHAAFCYDHANYYLKLSETRNVTARCPSGDCRKLIEGIII